MNNRVVQAITFAPVGGSIKRARSKPPLIAALIVLLVACGSTPCSANATSLGLIDTEKSVLADIRSRGFLSDGLRTISDTSTARAAETCAAIIMAARTAAKLEPAIIECFKMKLTIKSVRAELEKKTAALMNNKREIPSFMAELPPDVGRDEYRYPEETRVQIVLSIESPGVIRPYIGFIDLSLKPSGEVNWIDLGITDHPI